MTDLIKELRELHAKTTQGEWTDILETGAIRLKEGSLCSMESYDKKFIVKVHNELPTILEKVNTLRGNYFEENMLAKGYENLVDQQELKLKNYKKALELSKRQRDFVAAEFIRVTGDNLALDIFRFNDDIQEILEGKS